jgi:tRNA pseudouridine55 synthase
VNHPASLLLIDKPEGVTSHAVVALARRVLGEKRIGHLGTLDPFASGLLPLLIGGMTRLSDLLMDGDKSYLFTLSLGTETDTLDPSGQTVATAGVPQGLNSATLDTVLQKFRGTIEQVPPAYSALKHQGRPLYEYMRTQGQLGFDLNEKKRSVVLHHLIDRTASDDYAKGILTLEVVCSKGTYIRSLARDIAHTLGTVGHCARLRRLAVGNFQVSSAAVVLLEDMAKTRQNPPDQGTLAELQRSFREHVLPVKRACEQAGLDLPWFHINGSEPWAPTQVRERLNAGNRVLVESPLAEDFFRRQLPTLAEGSGSSDFMCFVQTPERLFLARLVHGRATSIEPIKLVEATPPPRPTIRDEKK